MQSREKLALVFVFKSSGWRWESPPTFGSLYFHILRANYVALLWKNADVSHPNLPSPTDFGWEVDNASGSFIPKRCLHQPAPESVLKLIRCWCKTGCGKACWCFKNNNPCTEICSCMHAPKLRKCTCWIYSWQRTRNWMSIHVDFRIFMRH